MNSDYLPHKLLFDCECLLQEIAKKYPDSLLDVLNALKEIKIENELLKIEEKEWNPVLPKNSTILTVKAKYKGRKKPNKYILDDNE